MYYCYPYMFIGRVRTTATRICSLIKLFVKMCSSLKSYQSLFLL